MVTRTARIERQFQGLVLQELNKVIEESKELAEFRAQALQEEEYADILVEGKGGKRFLIIQLKDPIAPDGRSPYQSEVVTKESTRASQMGCRFFVTFNMLQAVLWDRVDPDVPLLESDIKDWLVLDQSDVQTYRGTRNLRESGLQKLKEFLKILVTESMVSGRRVTPLLRPVDERVVRRIDSLMNGFGFEIATELVRAYDKSTTLQKHVIDWTRNQYWSWEGTPQTIFGEMEKLTRVGLLMLINKLVFYRAMQSSGFFRYLPPLQIPNRLDTAKKIKEYLWTEYFEKVTREIDYETIFGEKSELLNEVIFESDAVADFVIEFVDQIKQYDFSKLEHDIVGRIFEGLIREEERHKMGQYFTDPKVVDLILAYCLRDKSDKILDPGCGSGTFLVRAHSRLNALGLSHKRILEQLWGIDVAPYPAHLSTLNLAIRDLRFEQNYPRIVNKDFFEVDTNTRLSVVMPDGKPKEMSIGVVDAVVGNPPYTRQEEMEEIFEGVKTKAQSVVERETGFELSKRAGIHAYFLLHGGSFLNDGGRLGFVVSNAWLDQVGPVRQAYLCEYLKTDRKGRPKKVREYLSEDEFYNAPKVKVLGMKYDLAYGTFLQDYLLNNFRIDGVIDSRVEKWFPDADVNTCIILLTKHKGKNDNALVRFVRLKVGLDKILTKTNHGELLKSVLSHNSDFENNEVKVRVVTQGSLRKEGIDAFGNYVGSKWGSLYVRAPDIFFEVERAISGSSIKIKDLFAVRYGTKTGCNEFFIVKDLSETLKDKEVRELFGMTRSQIRNGKLRIIEPSGGGKPHLVEEKYLKSVVKSAREVAKPSVSPEDTNFMMLLVNDPPEALKHSHVWNYIEYGMKNRFGAKDEAKPASETDSCASRPIWYSLSFAEKPDFLVQKSYDKIFVVPLMKDVVATDRFYSLTSRQKVDLELIGGVLNSSIQHLIAEVNGRAGLGGGALDLMTFEVANLTMFDPRNVDEDRKRDIVVAFRRLKRRAIESWDKELVNPERIDLDNAVLRAMGVPSSRIDSFRQKLYDGLTDLIDSRSVKAASFRAGRGSRSVSELDVLAYHLMGEFREAGILKKSPRRIVAEFEKAAKLRISNKRQQKQLVEMLWETAFPDTEMPETQTTLGSWQQR
jgi:methylase of polypeptide subunit release factors